MPGIVIPNVKTIAVAGTPTTLSCIKQGIKIYNEELVDNSIISIKELNDIIDHLANMSKIDISLKYGEIVNGRADLLLAGSLILNTIMQKLKIDRIIIGSKGLRYGMVIDYLIKNQLLNTEKWKINNVKTEKPIKPIVKE